jgi:putative membrane protein
VLYSWLKAFHIIGFVAWFAGLFYIFRLYVYHVENRDKPEITQLLETMERRLYRGICWPAMIFTAAFGIALFVQMPGFYMAQGWFHAKLLGLVLLIGYHLYCGKVRRDLAAGRYNLTSRQCRMLNEAPLVPLFLIVIMVVVKPHFGG